MSVPFKSTLSCVWARATRKDKAMPIHSRTFESESREIKYCERLYGGVMAGPLYTQTVPYNSYTHAQVSLVAKPIAGDADNYRLYVQADMYYSNDADTGLAPRLRSPRPSRTVTPVNGVYTKTQAVDCIEETEAEWLKQGRLPVQKQPKAYRKQQARLQQNH
jgi:hypothetical protein